MKTWLRNYILVAMVTALVVGMVRVALPAEEAPSTRPYNLAPGPVQDCERSEHLQTEEQLHAFVASNPATPPAAQGTWAGPTLGLEGPRVGLTDMSAGGSTSVDYSRTNVQVEGVDEYDIVKTDGKYIYTISGDEVVILEAYPSDEAGVVSRIQFDDMIEGLFINGDRLVVLTTHWNMNYRYSNVMIYPPDYPVEGPRTTVVLYDVEDRSSPALVEEVSFNGTFMGARLYNGYLYVIAYDYIYKDGPHVMLPLITTNAESRTIDIGDIEVIKNPSGKSNDMLMVLALDTMSDLDYDLSGFLTGWMSTLYVSERNIYVAGISYDYQTSGFLTRTVQTSTVHKIGFEGTDVEYVCSGVVPGGLLNQFSMDEYRGNLRVATTVNGWNTWFNEQDSQNNVYVLDEMMAPLGGLEGLAEGERIYSVRFMGDRAYLVTFRQVDPFFVIDLSDPAAPKVLGELKIPGFSEYLHPFGPNHVIGLGRENGGWSSLKLSLFDVTDVSSPKEVAKAIIDRGGGYSEAEHDHKAFLFSAERGILAIPVNVWEYSPDSSMPPNRHGFWQGVYVYSVSIENGFTLRGKVTHGEPDGWNYIDGGSLTIRRSLYIEEVFYTVSEGLVKMNDIDDLSFIGQVELR